MNKRPIIALGPNSWVGPWAGRQQLLSRLAARGWPVVYSTGTFSVWDRDSTAWQKAPLFSATEVRDGVTLHHSGKLLPRWARLPGWDYVVYQAHARSLRDAARRISTRAPILFLFHPKFGAYLRCMANSPLVYHAFDTFSQIPGWSADAAIWERQIVDKADLVFATSRGIGAALPGTGPARYRELENGADDVAFRRGPDLPCPADLSAVPGPRIGYVGRITAKLNVELMADLAEARPDWQWVFVGPVILPKDRRVEMSALARTGLERLGSLANVHFLGEKSHLDLPAYVAHMDVNTLCYRLEGGWWVSCYPLKLHEYLATGRPVVATPLDAVREFADVVGIAEGRDAWLSALAHAIERGGVGNATARRDTASRNNWESRVDILDAALCRLDSPTHVPSETP